MVPASVTLSLEPSRGLLPAPHLQVGTPVHLRDGFESGLVSFPGRMRQSFDVQGRTSVRIQFCDFISYRATFIASGSGPMGPAIKHIMFIQTIPA
ncbi:MAG: hypothetical protein ACTSU9_13135 [Promethearchaeota archaeon]